MEQLALKPVFADMDENEQRQYIAKYMDLGCRIFVKSVGWHDAEDVLQDLYIDLWNNRLKYDPERAKFRTFAYNRSRAVLSEHIKERRKQSQNTQRLYSSMSLLYSEQSELESQETIDSVLSLVSEEDEQVIKRTIVDEEPIKRVASDLGKEPWEIYKILEKLKQLKELPLVKELLLT